MWHVTSLSFSDFIQESIKIASDVLSFIHLKIQTECKRGGDTKTTESFG